MASQAPRQPSITSNSTTSSRRPKSRASTASIQSASTQSSHRFQHASESVFQYPAQPTQASSLQFTPEEMITRSEKQLTNPNLDCVIDPSLQNHTSNGAPYGLYAHSHGHSSMNRPPLSQHPSFSENSKTKNFNENPPGERHRTNPYNAFDRVEILATEHSNENQSQDEATAGDGKKKKGSATSIANDQELRKLFRENQGQSLKEVSLQVLANDRGPKAEKTKQIFAMLWLNSVCKRAKGSVPRSVVFSHYATRCGTERVPPLNPASFGKLVRIIFPGIQTRRLGMRTKSKYHYVDLLLAEDHTEVLDAQRNRLASLSSACQQAGENATGRSHRARLPADTAVFPSPGSPLHMNLPGSKFRQSITSEMYASGGLFINHSPQNLHHDPSRANMVKRELKFAAPDDPFYDANDPIDLPSIHSYLPTETDIDVADALSALYRSHCISVIDCLRYCKAKMLFHSFTSFHGTLTVPVQKLFAHPNIAAWIKQCDWLMYQKMIRFVAPLALQAVPVQVIEAFKTVSTRLGSHVSTTFENLPQHVLDARLGPATIFANLLNRVIRVNQTAHAAANILNRDANRHQMWHDWVSYVKPFEVVQSSLPISGYSRVLRVLTSEIRDLLGPLDNSSCAGAGTIFETASNQSTPDYAQTVHIDPDNESPEGVLDRWINFLRNLPLRFPEADVRLILHCVNDIGSAALRDITMGQALSFGSWWVTKVWVDEMLQWLAEKGGFMQDCPESLEMRPKSYMDMDVTFMDEASEVFPVSRSRIDVSESVDPTIRFGSVDVGSGFHREQSRSASAAQQQLQQAEQSRIDIAEVNQVSHVRLAPAIGMDHMQSHDDSGIGMGVEDDELSMAKFGRFIEDGVDGESDPANVEVC